MILSQMHIVVIMSCLLDSLKTQCDPMKGTPPLFDMLVTCASSSVADRKLAEMKSAMHVVDEEVGGLEEQQAELLRQLAAVQQHIAAAKAKRVGVGWPLHLQNVCPMLA